MGLGTWNCVTGGVTWKGTSHFLTPFFPLFVDCHDTSSFSSSTIICQDDSALQLAKTETSENVNHSKPLFLYIVDVRYYVSAMGKVMKTGCCYEYT